MLGTRTGRAAATLACLVVLAACGSSTKNGAAGSEASATATGGPCPTDPVPVVVSVDQWGDIVGELAGACGDVTTIFKSSSADPHDYEPTPADAAEFTGAKLVVVNGLDYDPWADKAVATLDHQPVVVNGGKVVGLENGDNPHIWYGPGYVRKVANAVTAALQRLEPRDREYFASRNTAWRASMQPYDAEIARIKPAAAGKTYGATEGIFDYMAQALGLHNETPDGYQNATANESDPGPGDLHAFEQALADGKMTVLIFNTQTEGSIPDQIRSKAEDAKAPVVDVTESVPPAFHSFVSWQLSQLRDLASALGA